MLRIRLAGEPDAEALAAIYAPFVEHTAVSFETVPPGRDEMQRRIIETTAVYPWLVCERASQVVGYAYATQHRVRAAYRWSVDTSAYVDAAHHRLGIGRGLYASLFEVLRAQGFFNAYAGITLPNAASIGLHEAVGFTYLGTYEKVGYKFGTWHDVGWWQLSLRPHAEHPDEPLALPSVMARPHWERVLERGEPLIRETPDHDVAARAAHLGKGRDIRGRRRGAEMRRKGKLLFLCGKMAAGKSTLSKELARREDAVLLAQDEFIERLFPGEIVDVPSFLRYSTRIQTALAPHICSLLTMGVSVVLDFPGNTKKQRAWFRDLFERAGVDHELHFIEASDDVCKRQLKERSKGLPPGTKWTTDADFDLITAYFAAPAPEEHFNVVRHERA